MIGLCGLGWGIVVHLDLNRDTWQVVAFWLTPTILLTCHGVLSRELTARFDRRIAAGLTRRVTRGAHVPIRMMLGRSRIACAWSVIVLAVIAGARGLDVLSRWRWPFLAWLAATSALTALQVWRVMTRPAIASGPESLAVDERLRSNDAFQAITMLGLCMTAVSEAMVGQASSSWVPASVWTISVYAFLLFYVRARPPWVDASAPRPGPAATGGVTDGPPEESTR